MDPVTANPQMLAQALRKRNWALDPAGYPIDLSRPAINNPDGSISTEETATDVVGGRAYNYPTIWNGQRKDPDEAFRLFALARRAGHLFPVFGSIEEAERQAVARSQMIGNMRHR